MEPSANARYQRAISYCADSILTMHFGERVVNKIFGRAIQSRVAGLIVIMHCEAQLGIGKPPTLAALQQQFGSHRTLASFVGLLKLAGFVNSIENAQDRRARILAPTAQITDGLRNWLPLHSPAHSSAS